MTEWIEIKNLKDLPGNDTEVIGLYSESKEYPAETVGNVWHHKEGRFSGLLHSRDPYPVYVTCWMPKPKPPKK